MYDVRYLPWPGMKGVVMEGGLPNYHAGGQKARFVARGIVKLNKINKPSAFFVVISELCRPIFEVYKAS